MLGVPPHLADPMNGSMARPIGLPPPFVNLNHPALQGFAPLAAMGQPALGGQIPLGGMHGMGHLNLASQAMIPGLPPIVVTAVVMPNGAAVHPIQQLQQHKRLRSHATPLSVEEALHAARLEGLTLHVAPSTKTGYKGMLGPEPLRPARSSSRAPSHPSLYSQEGSSLGSAIYLRAPPSPARPQDIERVAPPPSPLPPAPPTLPLRREPGRQVVEETVPGGAGPALARLLRDGGGGGADVRALHHAGGAPGADRGRRCAHA